MTEEKKQELRQLLVEAMANLEIQHSKRGVSLPPVDLNDYRKLLLIRWASQTANSPLVWETFEPKIDDQPIKSRLLDFIREAFAPYIHEDKIESACSFVSYSLGGGYPLDRLLEQLLKIAIGRGIENAVSSFAKYTDETRISVKSLVLLEGISLKTEFQFHDKIQLIPLPNSPSKLPEYLPTSTYNSFGISANFFCGKTLLQINYFVSPAFRHPLDEAARLAYFTHEKRSSDVLEFLCQGLSLACNSAVQASLKWPFWPEHELFYLNPPGPGPPRFSVPHDVFEGAVEVEQSHIDHAQRLFKILDKNPDIREKVRVPINRWIKSKTPQEPIDKIIDLGIAFEALYVPDGGGDTTYKLAIRAARYLGKDKKDREDLLVKFKQIYRCRSKAVHEGHVDTTVKFGKEKISSSKLITHAQDLCLQSIKNILDKPAFPDWDSLILGGEKEEADH